MSVRVELCITNVEDARHAEASGVDSVELCAWLSCGGITPSHGMITRILQVMTIPMRVLIRPGPGDFTYDQDERKVILNDVETIGEVDSIGMVTGAMDGPGSVDMPLMRSIRALCENRELTFHRAIDHSNDPLRILEQCTLLSVDRILSSGGRRTALEGASKLAELVRRAKAGTRIAAAGSIGPDNVVELVERTGVQEVHFAAQRPMPDTAHAVPLSSSYQQVDRRMVPDEAKVEGVLNALVKAGLR